MKQTHAGHRGPYVLNNPRYSDVVEIFDAPGRDMLDSMRASGVKDLHAWLYKALGMPGDHFAMIAEDGLPLLYGAFNTVPVMEHIRYSHMFVTARVRKYGHDILRAVREIHDSLERHGVTRFVTVGYSPPTLDRWHRAIGYEVEGTHPRAGANGETFKTWGRVVS